MPGDGGKESWLVVSVMMRLTRAIRDALAIIGAMSAAALFGLHQSGLFHWAAKKLPDNTVLQLLFGAS